MGYMNKQPSRIQECKGNFIFQSRAEWVVVFGQDMKFYTFFVGVARGCQIAGPNPYPPPLQVRRGSLSVCRS